MSRSYDDFLKSLNPLDYGFKNYLYECMFQDKKHNYPYLYWNIII